VVSDLDIVYDVETEGDGLKLTEVVTEVVGEAEEVLEAECVVLTELVSGLLCV